MAWQCRLVVIDPSIPLNYQTKEVGTMWYADPQWAETGLLSDDYVTNHKGKRLPLFVRLPCGIAWCVDQKSYDGAHWGAGWTVTGEAPGITVSPSVNFVGRYHGYLQNGVLTDDVEGRQFNI